MGNKLSCSCAPLVRKGYRNEDTPWQNSRKRDGHLMRLWAEVFHVSTSSAGTVRWQQISEDLVPVNISCIQDHPDYAFHITAYNSQVDKILDVRLTQPGTRIGQASECFVYWKDPVTNDTWGLNFTSPADARAFRECCSPAFKFSRKASSSYSLRLESGRQRDPRNMAAKRRTISTPASPSHGREPQCTCMTPEQYARLRAQDPRYRGSMTLPRTQQAANKSCTVADCTESSKANDKVSGANSSTSVYDNVNAAAKRTVEAYATLRQQPRPEAATTEHKQEAQKQCCAPAASGSSTTTAAVVGNAGTNSQTEQTSLQQQQQAQDTASTQTQSVTTQTIGGSVTTSTSSTDLGNSSNPPQQQQQQQTSSQRPQLVQSQSLYSPYSTGGYQQQQQQSPYYSQNYFSEMQGAIPRNYPHQQSIYSMQQQYPHGGYYPPHPGMAGGYVPMQPQLYCQDQQSTYNPYYQRSYSVQGYSSSDFGTAVPDVRHSKNNHPSLRRDMISSKSIDYSEMEASSNGAKDDTDSTRSRRSKSKSIEDMHGLCSSKNDLTSLSLDSNALKRMLQPVQSMDSPNASPLTSPESARRPLMSEPRDGFQSEPENHRQRYFTAPGRGSSLSNSRGFFQGRGSSGSNTRGRSLNADSFRRNLERSLYLDFERGDGASPPSDNIMFDHNCYATTPSSSNGNSDLENPPSGNGNRGNNPSPTSRLLLEYEMHLRNTLAKGMDAESCSLHTFEALLTQSMENLAGVPGSGPAVNSNTLPTNLRDRGLNDRGRVHRNGIGSRERESSFYSERSDVDRSMYSDRDRGYLSDISSRANSFYDRQDSLRSGYMSDRESRAAYGVVQQTSVESADSRLCYLTSSEMSDDDRLSLTTAVSDDDDGESEGGHQASPFRKSGAAASFNCTGAVRKAGFLSVKKWLLRKKHQVELARKRGWRGYWVCLKGTTLLFYPCDSREGRHVEAAPKHLIIVDGAIMQPIPEHPKRDFIFCLSTAFGDAYLFQAPCQAELDTWVNSIHSACAAAFARHRGKTGTLHLLQEEIFRLERSIESDNKLKHMAELQLSVVSEAESRRQIGAQIAAWEENLERLHCEQFRLRCYMASLQHGELPNPKSLLTHVSRSTKNTLNRLGVFTVSSFHAYICARSPSLLNNLLAGRGATRRRTIAPVLSRSNSLCSRKSHTIATTPGSANPAETDRIFKVNLPDGQTATVTIRENMTVEEFLASACAKKNLNAAEHFVRVKKRRDMDNSNHFVPHRSDLIELYVPSHESVEICTKSIYQVELARNTLEQMWGFSVEAELVENSERQDELCVFVSRVEDRSIAMNHGIIKGDEIMVINGALVGDLDMMYIESVLQEEICLSLMMRSCRANPPEVNCLLQTTDDLIDSLVCPPPPSDSIITDDVLSNLIVPAPSWKEKDVQSPPASAGESFASFPTDRSSLMMQRQSSSDFLPKRISEISSTNRSSTSSDMRRSSPTGSVASTQSQAVTPSRQLSEAEKLKKCILELVETERTYVMHLNNLLENYLEPLKKETFLSSAEINALFGNIQEIVAFQRLFLNSLEEAMGLEANFEHFDQAYQFQNVLFAIGNAFLHHAQNFKLYSSFCASHSKAQKILLPSEGSQALQEFLQSRNPRQQHSSTLESYLIKPIQRILKYPLLLQQLCNLTDSSSSEHQHLAEALKGMEKVAEHINEMQRIHEEYGAIFDHLCRQHQKSCKQPVDLNPGELLYYGGVEWLNISDFLGKVKKGLELHAMCFVFKTAVVFLCKERLRQKKKLMSVSTKSMAPEVEIIRYQVLIPVTEVQVRAAAAKDVESHYLWELIHLKNPLHRRSEKVYHLSNSTGEFRNAFLKTIRQIIRESVRNMSIPPAKPPVPQLPAAAAHPRLLNPSLSEDKGKKRGLQRHSAGNIDYDNLEICPPADHPEPEDPPTLPPFRARSQTVGDGSAAGEKSGIRKMNQSDLTRDLDPGVKSESEEDPPPKPKPTLGRTPNHLSLSTTSTLSTGSTSSQARLIQASKTPQSFTPQPVAKPLGSPIWKPRDGVGEAFTLPRLGRTASESQKSENAVQNYGTLGFPSKK